MSGTFDQFNALARTVIERPELPRHKLIEIFREIEYLTKRGTLVLVQGTSFVEDNLCFALARIATGAIKNKKMYRGKQQKEAVAMGGGVEIGAENTKILGVGFDLFKLSGTNRAVAYPLVLKVLRSLRLQNSRYEKTLRAFLVITENYCDIEEELSSLSARLHYEIDENNKRPEDMIELMERISYLTSQKRDIELECGAAYPNKLYGVVAYIKSVVDKIHTLQGHIVESYLKLVLKTVKRYAYSDLDACDMFQAGSFGLWRAVSDYDYQQRTAFQTYARRWINQRIQGFRKKSGGPLIQLSDSVWSSYHKIQAAEAKLQADDYTADITPTDIAAELGWELDKVEEVFRQISSSQVMSYDGDLNEAADISWSEPNIIDHQAEESRRAEHSRQHLFSLLQNLDSGDRTVICLREGFLEGIDNSGISKKEALHEMLCQITCKTLVSQFMDRRLDYIQSVPMTTNKEKNEV